jgi:hypothetical protein
VAFSPGRERVLDSACAHSLGSPLIWFQICCEAWLEDLVFEVWSCSGLGLVGFCSAPIVLRLLFSYSSFCSSVSSNWISSIGIGGGVVAMVQPIQAPMPRTAIYAMNTWIVTSQSRMASKAGKRGQQCMQPLWLRKRCRSANRVLDLY